MTVKTFTRKTYVCTTVVSDDVGFKYNAGRKMWELYDPFLKKAHWCVAVDTSALIQDFVLFNWKRKHPQHRG